MSKTRNVRRRRATAAVRRWRKTDHKYDPGYAAWVCWRGDAPWVGREESTMAMNYWRRTRLTARDIRLLRELRAAPHRVPVGRDALEPEAPPLNPAGLIPPVPAHTVEENTP